MEAGEIVEIGKHADLMARNGAYARLCHSQILNDRPLARSSPIEVA
jgi:ABC-type multidrug transport system fused ATPase/permease subunit